MPSDFIHGLLFFFIGGVVECWWLYGLLYVTTMGSSTLSDKALFRWLVPPTIKHYQPIMFVANLVSLVVLSPLSPYVRTRLYETNSPQLIALIVGTFAGGIVAANLHILADRYFRHNKFAQ